MALRHEKAAIAMLLCSPSTLSKLWRAEKTDDPSTTADMTKELDRLGFSADGRAAALKTMRTFEDVKDIFGLIAARLLEEPWDGVEPHPADPDGPAIVAALKPLP